MDASIITLKLDIQYFRLHKQKRNNVKQKSVWVGLVLDMNMCYTLNNGSLFLQLNIRDCKWHHFINPCGIMQSCETDLSSADPGWAELGQDLNFTWTLFPSNQKSGKHTRCIRELNWTGLTWIDLNKPDPSGAWSGVVHCERIQTVQWFDAD